METKKSFPKIATNMGKPAAGVKQNSERNFREARSLTDAQLYQRCKTCGQDAREAMRKFAGLLPEVYRRRLYKRRGYASIHHFASVLAGMSHASVDKILRLSVQVEDKPTLKKQLETGSASWSKIEKVAYVATPETEKEWAEKVEKIPQPVLEMCVKEFRQNNRLDFTLQSDSQPEKWNTLSFKVSLEVELKLRQLKQKLEKEKGETLSFGEVLGELLEGVTTKEKKTVIQVCPDCIKNREQEREKSGKVPRKTSVKVERLVLARQENCCGWPGCNRPVEVFHHTRRFALKKSHDPDYIAGLCRAHHKMAHSGLIENEEGPVAAWRVRTAREWRVRGTAPFWDLKNTIDERVVEFRDG